MDSLDVLKVKFTHSNTVRDKKPYTIYEIEVRSSSTITWVIYKRYSSFDQLDTDLQRALTAEQKVNLPRPPPKRYTRSLAVEFVEKRKNELQDYLRALLETPGLVHSPVILSFLEVPDSVRPMLAAAMQQNQQNGGLAGMQGGLGGFGNDLGGVGGKDGYGGDGKDSSSSSSSKLQYASKTPDERRILELINLLKFHPNKVTAIKNFEEWFFQSRPRLAPEFVKLLLQGKNGSDNDGGLIQTIGDISYSHVASRAALYLLCRLLDVEKNKDAHLFLDAFINCDLNVLKKMQINQHIISERGNRIGAFKIIHILRNSGPVGGGQMGPVRTEAQLEQVVNDSWAMREYYKWSERKSDTSGQIVPFNHTTSQNKDNIYTRSLNLSGPTGVGVVGTNMTGQQGKPADTTSSAAFDNNNTDLTQMRYLRAKISEINQELRRILEEKETFVGFERSMTMDSQSSSSKHGNNNSSASSSSEGWRVVSLVTQFDSAYRPILPTNELSYDDDVSILYRNMKSPSSYGAAQDIVCVKMVCLLPYRMEEVAPYLADLRRRKEWDLKYHRGKCLEVRHSQEYAPQTNQNEPSVSLQYPEYQTDIVHMVFKSFSSPYKYRDVVVVRAFTEVCKTRKEFEQEGFAKRQVVGTGAGGAASSPAAASSAATSPDLDPSTNPSEDPLFRGEGGFFDDGGMIFATRSVIHPSGPEYKDNVRAVLYPTGYVLTPLRDQGIEIHDPSGSASSKIVNDFGSSCKLTFLTQMDRESVLIVSPDLLGETNELRQTFNNIKACLARDYGLRTLRASTHTRLVRQYAGRPDPATLTRGPSIVTQNEQSTPATYQHRYQNVSETIQEQESPQQRGVAGSTSSLPSISEKR